MKRVGARDRDGEEGYLEKIDKPKKKNSIITCINDRSLAGKKFTQGNDEQ